MAAEQYRIIRTIIERMEVIKLAQLTVNSTGQTNTVHLETVPKMVTVNELAKLVNISTYAIRKLVRANKITYFKSGSKVLINLDKFIDFLNGEQ